MRVLHVSQPTTYGVRQYLTDLLADQVGRGWELTLATPPDEALEAACLRLGVAHRRWDARRAPGPATLRETRAVARIIREVAPEVVHLHSSKAGLAGRLALRGRRPTVFTPHAWSFFHGGPVTRYLALRWERWATRWTHVILCGSEGERSAGERAGLRARWAVVPNAVDRKRFAVADEAERTSTRARLGLPQATPVAVCVGRLARQKGQDVLLQAWREVHAAVPEAMLYLVGDGPDRAALAALAAPNVHFAGHQGDVRAWLVAADVVVQPSRWETLSLSALEALACGSSVVATDVSGMREAIGTGAEAAGEVVPVGERSALAHALIKRLRNPELVRTERLRAPLRAAGYGTDSWGPRIAAILEDAARGSGDAPMAGITQQR